MHSFQSSGYTIHHNGDYSGAIEVEDENGDRHPDLTFEQIIRLVSENTSSQSPLINILRDLVANAIRSEVISLWEQLDTDAILLTREGKAVLNPDHFKGTL